MDEYKEALAKAEDNLRSCKSDEERSEVVKSIEIVTKKLDEQARHLAWVGSAVFTLERQQFVHNLMVLKFNGTDRSDQEEDSFDQFLQQAKSTS